MTKVQFNGEPKSSSLLPAKGDCKTHPISISDDDDDVVVVAKRFSSRKRRRNPWISQQPFIAVGDGESSSSTKIDPIIIMIQEEEEADQMFVCEICTESKPQTLSFNIKGCSHSYCCDCIRSYVTSKLENAVSQINCPFPDCYSGTLDPELCKKILPFKVFVRWGQLLCESSIPADQKFYCPFKDCSALLLRDAHALNAVQRSECPFCFRLFCACCKAPWHQGLTCAQYQELNEDDREKSDLMFVNLAIASHWQRCPNCKIYVEKVAGCFGVICRCGILFCYMCRRPLPRNFFQCLACAGRFPMPRPSF